MQGQETDQTTVFCAVQHSGAKTENCKGHLPVYHAFHTDNLPNRATGDILCLDKLEKQRIEGFHGGHNSD